LRSGENILSAASQTIETILDPVSVQGFKEIRFDSTKSPRDRIIAMTRLSCEKVEQLRIEMMKT